MTSVKEFRIERPATGDRLGRGSFVFTDAYSVFDWGVMPDELPGKGASLCTMGAYNFERLEREGVPTHYRGVVDGGRVGPLTSLDAPPREMAIDLTQTPPLPHDGRSYDYEEYHRVAGRNYLIPLEVVFRNRVPIGSSLRRRTDPADHGLPFDDWPDEPIDLDEPIVEFSSKFEESDRYLDRRDADRIAGEHVDVDELESIALTVNRLVTQRAERAGMVHEDGKIECLSFDGEVRVADVVGTLDENRFSYEGQQVSKEVIRQYLKRTQPEWVDAISRAKAEAKRTNVADWRSLCDREPAPLPDDVVELGSELYLAAANEYTDGTWFDAPSLSAVVEAVRSL